MAEILEVTMKKLQQTQKPPKEKQQYQTNKKLGCTSGGVYVPCIYTHAR